MTFFPPPTAREVVRIVFALAWFWLAGCVQPSHFDGYHFDRAPLEDAADGGGAGTGGAVLADATVESDSGNLAHDASNVQPVSDGSVSVVDADDVSADAAVPGPDAAADGGIDDAGLCGPWLTWCEGQCVQPSPFLHCNF